MCKFLLLTAAAAAKSLQSCLTLCDPIDCSPPGSAIPGILRARTLEWVAVSFSNAWKWKVKEKSLSRVRLLVTPWTGAYQAPPSMGFSRQEYWSGVPLLVSLNFSKCWHFVAVACLWMSILLHWLVYECLWMVEQICLCHLSKLIPENFSNITVKVVAPSVDTLKQFSLKICFC